MREVNIKVTKRGSNYASRDLKLRKIYPAVRYEAGERDDRGVPGDMVFYVVYDEVGDRCGIYRDWDGIIIKEV